MKKLFNVTLLFLLTLQVQSQQELKTSGYLGKRMTAEINMGMSYMHTNINPPSSEGKRKIFRGNLHPEFTFAYTIKRNTDIGFKIGYDRVKFKYLDRLVFTKEPNDTEVVYNADLTERNNFYASNSEVTQYFDFSSPEKIGTSFNYQVFFRFYNHKYIAPIGFYHQISMGINRISFKNNEIVGTFEADPETEYAVKLQKYNMYQLSYFFGNKKMLKNEMYLNLGVEVNLIYKGELSGFFNAENKNDPSDTYHRYLPRKLGNSIMLSQLLEFKIGIGKIF